MRANAVRDARRRGIPLLLLESGDFLVTGKPRTPEQVANARAKADLIIRAYRVMGYDAVLPGEADFQLGSSLLRGEGTKGFPWTCLNLVSVKTGKPVFAPFRKVRRGNLDVTVVGLIGEGKFSKGSLAGLGWAVRPPHSTLREFLEGKEGRADVVVVLSHLGDDGDVALARSVRRPVIILEGHVATS